VYVVVVSPVELCCPDIEQLLVSPGKVQQ